MSDDENSKNVANCKDDDDVVPDDFKVVPDQIEQETVVSDDIDQAD